MFNQYGTAKQVLKSNGSNQIKLSRKKNISLLTSPVWSLESNWTFKGVHLLPVYGLSDCISFSQIKMAKKFISWPHPNGKSFVIWVHITSCDHWGSLSSRTREEKEKRALHRGSLVPVVLVITFHTRRCLQSSVDQLEKSLTKRI